MANENQKITIALGGGGARGFAHLGVLKILEKHFDIQAIVGTSMGALVGAIYCQLGNADKAISHFQERLDTLQHFSAPSQENVWFDDFSIQFRNQVLLHGSSAENAQKTAMQIENAINTLLEDTTIEETRIPFAAIASDSITGQEAILKQGNIRTAVLASSALPGITGPVQWDDKLLIDGAATSAVPIRAARAFANHFVIASDVSAALVPRNNFKNAVDIFMRNLQIISRHYHDELVKKADRLITPQVGEKHWNDFNEFDWFVEQGRQAALRSL